MTNITYGKKQVKGKIEIDYEKWIDLSELPRKGGGYNKIDWINSVDSYVNFRYQDIRGHVNIVKYKRDRQILIIKYNDNEFNINIGNFTSVKFGSFLGKYTDEFRIPTGCHLKDNKRDLIITDRKRNGSRKYYKYKCNKCGFDCSEHYKDGILVKEYWIQENNLLNNSGCSCCCIPSKVVVIGINDIPTTAQWMVGYFKGGYGEAEKYSYSSHKKINFKCLNCNEVRDKKICIYTLYNEKSIGCKKCSDGISYLSKYIYSTLKQLNLDFQTEVRYEWNKYINPKNNKLTQASIDFVIYHNDREIPLEADGAFHRDNNRMNGQTKEMSKYIDKQRDENCLRYLGEETIRITDEGDIKENMLNSKLSEIFDLSNIDWDKCNEFAMDNLIMKVCEYWNNKEEWETTKDLAKAFDLSRSTIINYLKRGNCDYDSKTEIIKYSSKNGKNNNKKVEMFKDGISLGVFKSISEIEKQSEELFGIKLNHQSISIVANGKRACYKGFAFKYIEENKNIAS